jgi:hypothetical protein
MLLALMLPATAAAADDAAAENDGAAAPPAVAAVVEPAEVLLGEPFELVIQVPLQGGRRWRLAERLELGPLAELGRDSRLAAGERGRRQELVLELASYEETGEIELDGLELVARAAETADGGPADGAAAPAERLAVPPVTVRVRSVLEGVDDPSPRDVAGPVSIRVPDYRPLVLLGVAGLWLLLGLTLLRRRGPVEAPARYEALPPPRQAHRIAFDKLEAIVAADLLRAGEFHAYFTRISETVREYLGNRYGFFALDLTSDELLAELRDRITPGLELAALERLLREADLVKFARQRPDDAMCSYAINTAYALVEATRLPEEPAAEGAEAGP